MTVLWPCFDGPDPAESPPTADGGFQRGELQSPNTAEGQGRRSTVSRVLTVRLEPTAEQWKLLRLRASQAAAYRNKHAQAKLAHALGWRLPEGEERPAKVMHRRASAGKKEIHKEIEFDLVKLVRERERGDLSSAVYLACEAEVKKDWSRKENGVSGVRRFMAGAKLPQYTGNNLPMQSNTNTPCVKIIESGDGSFVASLMVSGSHVEGGCWLDVPVSRRTKKDEYRAPMLMQIASGKIRVTAARVVFRLHKGMTLLQLTYSVERLLPPMGQRTATLSQLDDGRILLRAGPNVLDYTSRVVHLKNLRDELDEVMRRCQSQIGRRKGHARIKRRLISRVRFEDRQNTLLHQWSRDMADRLRKWGVGQLTVIGLVGGDWAAHKLMQMLAYKCEESGIKVIEHGEFDDPMVERTVKAAAAKAARKARKRADAAREILSANKRRK